MGFLIRGLGDALHEPREDSGTCARGEIGVSLSHVQPIYSRAAESQRVRTTERTPSGWRRGHSADRSNTTSIEHLRRPETRGEPSRLVSYKHLNETVSHVSSSAGCGAPCGSRGDGLWRPDFEHCRRHVAGRRRRFGDGRFRRRPANTERRRQRRRKRQHVCWRERGSRWRHVVDGRRHEWRGVGRRGLRIPG